VQGHYNPVAEIFDALIRDSDRVISIVGGGGKTSLLFLLAHAFQEKGARVVSTTTTRILKPTPQQSAAVVFAEGDDFQEKVQKSLVQYGHITVANTLLDSGDKLQGLSCTQVEQLFSFPCVELIIIEADGARRLSFKAPDENEPVVPQITDLFVGVIGLDIIGKPLDESHVFRAGLVSSLTGLPLGAIITPLTVATLAAHTTGLMKGCPEQARSTVFLNKTDLPGGEANALAVIEAAKRLKGVKPDFWTCGSILENRCESFIPVVAN